MENEWEIKGKTEEPESYWISDPWGDEWEIKGETKDSLKFLCETLKLNEAEVIQWAVEISAGLVAVLHRVALAELMDAVERVKETKRTKGGGKR